MQRSPSKAKQQQLTPTMTMAAPHATDVGGYIKPEVETSFPLAMSEYSMLSTPVPRVESEEVDDDAGKKHPPYPKFQADSERHDELPEPGLARSLLAKFQSMQHSKQ